MLTAVPLIDDETLLSAWAAGGRAHPAVRSAVVCAASGGASDVATALELPVDELAALAAELCRRRFGPVIPLAWACDDCGEQLELDLDLDGLLSSCSPDRESGGLRLPSSRDLARAAAANDPVAVLREACGRGDRRPSDSELDAAAGLADVVLVGACVGCGGESRVSVDLGELLWEQIASRAPRLLDEIAELAGAFGWTERDILDLPLERRAAYLDRVGR